MNCQQLRCTGEVVDGYCNVCGVAPPPQGRACARTGTSGAPASSRPTVSSGRSNRLGGGLVEVPEVPYRDPSSAVMNDPSVPERGRFCASCGEPVGRGHDGSPGRTQGFCRACGAPFSFAPKLSEGELVAGQYEVAGPLAHGGMGWIYLARDRNVADRWVVLKGLLNTADEGAMAAALAERRFLAEVEHPNIVKIFNFVQHERSGYIVMEYVGGSTLQQIRSERRAASGERPEPLPVEQAIAYILEILPAFAYLHRSRLLFCDFKPDNVIQTQHSLKLIDLGGVYHMDDASGPVYGTPGFRAPEIAEVGPSVASDLFTVARTLAVLCTDFGGYQTKFPFTLPPQDSVSLFGRYDSLYRFLLKGTAADPDDRFQSAEEMSEQLLGVLREVLAQERGAPVAVPSTLFTADLRADPDRPDWRRLPVLQDPSDDPAAGYLATLATSDPEELIALLGAAPQHTLQVDLRTVRAMIDAGDLARAEKLLADIAAADPREWRVAWYRGVIDLAREHPRDASASFNAVYEAVPGELAPKLALAVAAEYAGNHVRASAWYDVVSRTDPAYTTASFGLGRCRLATGDRAKARAAYGRVPESSSADLDAKQATIRCLIRHEDGDRPELAELQAAGAKLEALALGAEQRAELSAELLEAALQLVVHGEASPDRGVQLAGCRLVERELREGLERSYRDRARHAPSEGEHVHFVDLANQLRPETWT